MLDSFTIILIQVMTIVTVAGSTAAGRHPIIFIPGAGGSQTYCKLDNKTQAFPVWPRMRYNLTEHKGYDLDGVHIFNPGWGETWSVEYLDQTEHYFSCYLCHLISILRTDAYFVSNATLRSAPYDFRKAPHEMDDFLKQLKALVETTYRINGNRRVIIMGHSLGAINGLNFLQKQGIGWNRMYVKTFVSVSGPFAGAVQSLKTEASGDNMRIRVRSPFQLRATQRSCGAVAFLVPNRRFWPDNETLITTPNVNYTINDFERFYRDIDFPAGYEMTEYAQAMVDGSVGPPGVEEVYCVHGGNLPTTQQLVYKNPSFFRSAFPDQTPTMIYGPGDGTVNRGSLELCKQWSNVVHIELPGAEHVQIVQDERFVRLMMNLSGAAQTPILTTAPYENKFALIF